MLSNRCSDILKEIINNHKPVKIKYLADIFNVSSRTVRYDLDEIDYYLKSARFKTTCRKTNVGIFFNGDDDERRAVLKSIFKSKEDNANYTSRERKLIILVKRCLNEEPSTIESISGALGVSISTTLKDLEQLRSSFAQFGIAFRSFALSGGEADIRNAITNTFMLLLDKRTIYEIVRMISGESETILTSAYTQLFSHVGIELLQQSIRIYGKTVQTFLSNEKFLLYTVHLAVQARRIQLGKKLLEEDKYFLFDDGTYEAVAQIQALWYQYDLELDERERQYLLQTIEKIKFDVIDPIDSMNMADLQIMALGICGRVMQLISLPFEYDKILLDGLLVEIPVIINRAKTGVSQKQFFVRAVIDYSPVLFAAVGAATKPIAKLLKRKLSDDEVAGIAIYFADYRERIKIGRHRPRIILVGPEHGVIMRLIKSRLSMLFSVEIVAELATYELDRLSYFNADYIISCYQSVESAVPCIKVSPFLTTNDLASIKQVLPLCILIEPEGLAGKGICEVLAERSVCLDYDRSTMQDVIKESFERLQAVSAVKPQFLNDLYATANDMGLESVLINGVLFLHSRNFGYSKKLGISAIRLQKAMQLPDVTQESSVWLVLTLATPDSKGHLRAYKELVEAIIDEKKTLMLKEAQTSADFLQILRKDAAPSSLKSKEVLY